MSFSVISPFSMIIDASDPMSAAKWLVNQKIMRDQSSLNRFIIQDRSNNKYGGQVTFYDKGGRHKAKINLFPTTANDINSLYYSPSIAPMVAAPMVAAPMIGRPIYGMDNNNVAVAGMVGPGGLFLPLNKPAAATTSADAAASASAPAASAPATAPAPAPATISAPAANPSVHVGMTTPFGMVASPNVNIVRPVSPVFGINVNPLTMPATSMSSLPMYNSRSRDYYGGPVIAPAPVVMGPTQNLKPGLIVGPGSSMPSRQVMMFKP